MAGSLKYDLGKYSWYNFIGSVSWAAFAMSIGYFFGASYRLLFVYLKDVAYFIVFLGGAIALIYILKWVFRSAFIQALLNHNKVKYLTDKMKNGLGKILSNGDGDVDNS